MSEAPGHALRAELPIACTLGPDDGRARLDRWRRLSESALPAARLSEGELVIRYVPRPGVLLELQSLAVAEQTCCSFVTWKVSCEGDQPVLRVRAPADRSDAIAPIAAMFGLGGSGPGTSQ